MVTRREFIAGGAALTVGGPAFAQASAPGLDAIAQTRGLRFGSCASSQPAGVERGSMFNAPYAALLERDCGLLVAENEMKWQALRPDAKSFSFDRFSPIAAYAAAKGMKLRGHTLLWAKTERFPAWLRTYDFGAEPVKEAERLLAQHIRTVAKYFGKQIYSFDVVNETVDEKTGGQRDSSLAKAFGGGDAMCDFAFHQAREAMPGAELVYNDYMSWEPHNEAHRTGVLKLLERFRRDKVPVDTLGLQSHIGLPGGGTVGAAVSKQEKAWRGFLDEAVAMGYKLAITEFDVNDRAITGTPAVRDGIIANYAAAYLEITLSYPQIKDVLVWGMCDKYTWLNGFMPRADGQPYRSCPYDAGFKPKALYTAFADALKAAPVR